MSIYKYVGHGYNFDYGNTLELKDNELFLFAFFVKEFAWLYEFYFKN